MANLVSKIVIPNKEVLLTFHRAVQPIFEQIFALSMTAKAAMQGFLPITKTDTTECAMSALIKPISRNKQKDI